MGTIFVVGGEEAGGAAVAGVGEIDVASVGGGEVGVVGVCVFVVVVVILVFGGCGGEVWVEMVLLVIRVFMRFGRLSELETFDGGGALVADVADDVGDCVGFFADVAVCDVGDAETGA